MKERCFWLYSRADNIGGVLLFTVYDNEQVFETLESMVEYIENGFDKIVFSKNIYKDNNSISNIKEYIIKLLCDYNVKYPNMCAKIK